MMELIIIIVVTALILAVVAFVVLGTVITTMPWFAWVLIVAIICGFQYMRHLQKEKKDAANRQVRTYQTPFGRNGYNDMIDQTIEKELADYAKREKARQIRNNDPKMINVKNNNEHFKVLIRRKRRRINLIKTIKKISRLFFQRGYFFYCTN